MTPLTRREREVATLLAHTNVEIAERLCISVLTVGDHVKAILLKTETTTRTAAALALRAEIERRDRFALLVELVTESGRP